MHPLDLQADTTEIGDMSHSGTGIVKQYDVTKGYGFVVPDTGGRDLFLHRGVLIASAQTAPAHGDRVTYRSDGNPERPRIIRIEAISRAVIGPGSMSHPVHMAGRIKFFDPSRGYGFVSTADGEDVFVGAKLLRRLKVVSLPRENQSVSLTAIRSSTGSLVAESLRFLSNGCTDPVQTSIRPERQALC